MSVAFFSPSPIAVARWPLRLVATVASWVLAAGLVAGLGPVVALASGAGAALVFKVAAIVAVAGLLAARPLRRHGLQPSPWTGVAWLALTIVAEMVTAMLVHHGWCELLGDPAVRWMRNVLMLSWVGAPALFTRADHW